MNNHNKTLQLIQTEYLKTKDDKEAWKMYPIFKEMFRNRSLKYYREREIHFNKEHMLEDCENMALLAVSDYIKFNKAEYNNRKKNWNHPNGLEVLNFSTWGHDKWLKIMFSNSNKVRDKLISYDSLKDDIQSREEYLEDV